MAGKTGIEWTDATWNPIRGCSRVSEGCRNCYAEKVAYRFSDPGQAYHGLVGIGGLWNGQIKFVEEHLLDPLRWKKPRRIFVNSMSDLFHPNVTDEMLDKIFAVMALCPQHTFQVLTKRPERMLAYFADGVHAGVSRALKIADAVDLLPGVPSVLDDALDAVILPLANVWLGVSVENQKAADARIPLLLQTPAAVRFLSCEPVLGPVDLRCIVAARTALAEARLDSLCVPPDLRNDPHYLTTTLDWVIVGGESGPGARPMHPDWARSLRDQCVTAGVPFFFKQWGEWLPAGCDGAPGDGQALNCSDDPIRVGKKAAGHLLDGQEWHQFPEVRA